MKTSLRNLWLKRAALFSLIVLSTPVVQAQTTNSNNLTVLGFVDATNDISYGTLSNGTPAIYLQNTNGNNEFTAGQTSSVFLWQDGGTNTPNNKMRLDGGNNLTLFGTNGSAGVFLNPNANGGISLTSTGSCITFSDGSSITSANNLHPTAMYSSNGAYVFLTDSTGDIWRANGDTSGGTWSTVLGIACTAPGYNTTAFGSYNTASGNVSTVFGQYNTASGACSTAMGFGNTASALQSTAFGVYTTASGNASTAFGLCSVASAQESTAFGGYSRASGTNSTAFGQGTTAAGQYSTAFGDNTYSAGTYAITIGWGSYATGVDAIALEQGLSLGYNSTAFGFGTANADESAAFGFMTRTAAYGSLALGQFNVGLAESTTSATNWVSNDPVLEIGNGTSGTPGNAVTILKNGKFRAAGTIESPSGVRIPPMGDMSMGGFTNGNSPTNLSAANGLMYPGGN